MGDNDFMPHRVNPVGRREDGIVSGLSLESQLARADGDAWTITECGRELARFGYDKLRISVSWKAQVFADAEAARVADEHRDDLDLAEVFTRLRRDLARREVAVEWPSEPLCDPGLVRCLAEVYVDAPSDAGSG